MIPSHLSPLRHAEASIPIPLIEKYWGYSIFCPHQHLAMVRVCFCSQGSISILYSAQELAAFPRASFTVPSPRIPVSVWPRFSALWLLGLVDTCEGVCQFFSEKCCLFCFFSNEFRSMPLTTYFTHCRRLYVALRGRCPFDVRLCVISEDTSEPLETRTFHV